MSVVFKVVHWENFCKINDTFKRVIGILVNWHIPTGILTRIARAMLVKMPFEMYQFANTHWYPPLRKPVCTVALYTGKEIYVWNLDKLNQIWIAITLSWSIWPQTELRFMQKQSGKCSYNPNLVWINKIPKIFLWTFLTHNIEKFWRSEKFLSKFFCTEEFLFLHHIKN